MTQRRKDACSLIYPLCTLKPSGKGRYSQWPSAVKITIRMVKAHSNLCFPYSPLPSISTKSNLLGKLWKMIKIGLISSPQNGKTLIILECLFSNWESASLEYILVWKSVNEHRKAQEIEKTHLGKVNVFKEFSTASYYQMGSNATPSEDQQLTELLKKLIPEL